MFFLLLVPLLTFPVIVAVNFFYYLKHDRLYSHTGLMRGTELWTVVVMPWIFLNFFDLSETNDCCSGSAVFSPAHRTGIYTTIALSIVAYFYSSYRSRLAPPFVELLNNAALVLGMFVNVLIAIQISTEGAFPWLIGNAPILMLFILLMKKNKALLECTLQQEFEKPRHTLAVFSLGILQAKAWIRFPVLALLTLPLLLLISVFLYFFGQQPDTFVRAFTDTYKHGFSQLDYMCDNVQCGEHFLCSVAAGGHKKVVQPKRYGERNGHKIICNRQLLVANAFEEMLQTHLPLVHQHLRRQYNKVGKMVHRYYFIFNNKLVADVVYMTMKPLEWFFLLSLYTLDRRPENRIARQYLSAADSNQIQQQMLHRPAGVVKPALHKPGN